MEFTNLIAYCKNWYKHSGDVDTMWRDMAHCILCDGYLCTTKKEVAQFCMNKMDDYARKYPDTAYKVSFLSVFTQIQKNKDIFEISERNRTKRDFVLDDYDHICWAFRDIFAWIDADYKEGIIPNDNVLPLNVEISDTLWNKVKDFKVQTDKDWWYKSYDEREAMIK